MKNFTSVLFAVMLLAPCAAIAQNAPDCGSSDPKEIAKSNAFYEKALKKDSADQKALYFWE